jgi:hypothetical protein
MDLFPHCLGMVLGGETISKRVSGGEIGMDCLSHYLGMVLVGEKNCCNEFPFVIGGVLTLAIVYGMQRWRYQDSCRKDLL